MINARSYAKLPRPRFTRHSSGPPANHGNGPHNLNVILNATSHPTSPTDVTQVTPVNTNGATKPNKYVLPPIDTSSFTSTTTTGTHNKLKRSSCKAPAKDALNVMMTRRNNNNTKRTFNSFYSNLKSPRHNKNNNNKSLISNEATESTENVMKTKPVNKLYHHHQQQHVVSNLRSKSISSAYVSSFDNSTTTAPMVTSSSRQHGAPKHKTEHKQLSLDMKRKTEKEKEKVPMIDIQISSFTPVSRRVKQEPQFITIHASIPSSSSSSSSSSLSSSSSGNAAMGNMQRTMNEEKEIENDTLETESSIWIPITCLTCLPAVMKIPSTTKQLRISFHSTKPSKHIGDATTSVLKLMKSTQCIVAPVKQRNHSKYTIAVIFLRCSSSLCIKHPNASTEEEEEEEEEEEDRNTSLQRGGMSLKSCIAPSMIRESRHVCAIVLSVVLNDVQNNIRNIPYSWPAGRALINKKLDRSACIHVSRDVLWFGVPKHEKGCVLKLEWMGAPKKGLTFVHGVCYIQVERLVTLKKGQLLSISWTETPGSMPVNRSILIDHICFRDEFWFLELSLTR